MNAMVHDSVYAVGHSNHLLEHFIGLLQLHMITAVADVRSTPFSRANPQFNRDELKDALAATGIAYVFLGKELGARSEDRSCYEAGKVRYDRIAATDLFRKGLDRVREGSERFRLALMCAEREPLDCHRAILVGRYLETQGFRIQHIHGDGALESHADAISRLLRMLKIAEDNMFHSRHELIEEAYKRQEERIAYTIPASGLRTA